MKVGVSPPVKCSLDYTLWEDNSHLHQGRRKSANVRCYGNLTDPISKDEYCFASCTKWIVLICSLPFNYFLSLFSAPVRERYKFQQICREQMRPAKVNRTKFEQFLLCVVTLSEQGRYNIHWSPVYRHCDICHHQYTAPSKLLYYII